MKSCVCGAIIGAVVASMQSESSDPQRSTILVVVAVLVTIGICALLGIDKNPTPPSPPPES